MRYRVSLHGFYTHQMVIQMYTLSPRRVPQGALLRRMDGNSSPYLPLLLKREREVITHDVRWTNSHHWVFQRHPQFCILVGCGQHQIQYQTEGQGVLPLRTPGYLSLKCSDRKRCF